MKKYYYVALRCAFSASLVMAVLIGIYTSLFGFTDALYGGSHDVPSGVISRQDVRRLQEKLRERGFFDGETNGIYDAAVSDAVRKFQLENGIEGSGVSDAATLRALGLAVLGEGFGQGGDLELLARLISAEGGDSYLSKLIFGASVLNRLEDYAYPDTLAGIIFEEGAFESVTDGSFWDKIDPAAYRAARDVLNGLDPTG